MSTCRVWVWVHGVFDAVENDADGSQNSNIFSPLVSNRPSPQLWSGSVTQQPRCSLHLQRRSSWGKPLWPVWKHQSIQALVSSGPSRLWLCLHIYVFFCETHFDHFLLSVEASMAPQPPAFPPTPLPFHVFSLPLSFLILCLKLLL